MFLEMNKWTLSKKGLGTTLMLHVNCEGNLQLSDPFIADSTGK